MRNWLLVFYCLVALLSGAYAQQGWPPVYDIKTDTSMLTLDTTYFQILEDRSGELSFDQVRRNTSFYHGSFFDSHRRSHVYWLRMRVRNTLPDTLNLYLCDFSGSYLDLYWQNAKQQWIHERTGVLIPKSQLTKQNQAERSRLFFQLLPGQQTTLYQRSASAFWDGPILYLSPKLQTKTHRANEVYTAMQVKEGWQNDYFSGITLGILVLAVCYNLLIFFSVNDRVYLYFSVCLFFFILDRNVGQIQSIFFAEQPDLFAFARSFFFIIFFTFFIQSIRKFIQPSDKFRYLNRMISIALLLTVLANVALFFRVSFPLIPIYTTTILLEIQIRITYIFLITLIVKMMNEGSTDARFALLATTPLLIFWLYTLTTNILGYFFKINFRPYVGSSLDYGEGVCFAWLIIVFSAALLNRYSLARKQVVQQAIEKEQLEKEREIEKNRLIANQNELLEKQVEERTSQLKTSLENLKATQNQLIQQEKMASLGELTAGIAHEIQNPLNFVNNFSEVSIELVDELNEERAKDSNRDVELESELLQDLNQNLQKISLHGKRASNIVKGMLEHSRKSTGEREPTDLNALADEYLRLAYHGLRAKDKSFNATLSTDFDKSVDNVSIVAQDVGRVLLNLFTNAFYAVQQRQKIQKEPGYQPTVSITTRCENKQAIIRVSDNGTGMPKSVQKKIFQPFFTTKPTGEGTGLGLSLSYDIITKGHNGTITVESTEGQGTTFTITLPT
ncbi:histidine kinase [Spirosoma sp. BT702]|uniref:histidine kinase n=2 Tax=Spirosoma profusum TaxID=2771354 RepID=A0A926XXQ9_9BACT|nr:ATP-binding protein [Spirosoma profusum]MBD2699917.1 histidine kinase [Spirosoma profusum]